MATKHTPGPWSRYNDGPSSNVFIESTKGGSVCKIANNSHAEANANLIAAAPELFKFVEDQARTTNCICRIQAIVKNTHLESDLECTHCRAEKLIRLATRGEGT